MILIQSKNKNGSDCFQINSWQQFQIRWGWTVVKEDFKSYKFKISNIVYNEYSDEFNVALRKAVIWETLQR